MVGELVCTASEVDCSSTVVNGEDSVPAKALAADKDGIFRLMVMNKTKPEAMGVVMPCVVRNGDVILSAFPNLKETLSPSGESAAAAEGIK